MLPDIPPEQSRAAIEAIAREILLEGNVERPPVNAIELARRLDLIVARDEAAATRARFVRLGPGGGSATGAGTILLADDPRPERRQWAVAHEIGESRAHRVFAELGINPMDAPESAREAIANRLAGSLLLPWEWFRADGAATHWDLSDLKAIYSTASNELIARRMLEMPPPIIITLLDQGRCSWRRGNRALHPPPLTEPEQAAWRAARESGRPAECDHSELPEGIADVCVWPIHEEGWRREIIRMELSEW